MIVTLTGVFVGFGLAATSIGYTDKWFALPMCATGCSILYFIFSGNQP